MDLINKYFLGEITDDEFINQSSSKEEAIEFLKNIDEFRSKTYNSGVKIGLNVEKFNHILKNIITLTQKLNELKDIPNKENLIFLINQNEVKKLYTQLEEFIPKDIPLDIQVGNISNYFENNINHFSSIEIEEYNIFKDFKIDKLNRINIFAGFNNSGKTTLLEAIYLLVNQNNMSSFFNVIKHRNKLDSLNTLFLNDYFNNDISISGEFNDIKTNIFIKKFEAKIDKKNDYLNSYQIVSTIDTNVLDNTVHTFKNNPIQRYYDKIEVLCSSLYKSPYFHNHQEVINTHSKSIELKVFGLVVDFIRDKIDKNIDKIEFTDKDNIKRFLVDSKSFPEKSVNIATYGEGLQRIFEIALSFAYCQNGVLLIDELETAIHYSLLIDFTKFIQELARKFNVQVFLTSHSKECINAFVENGFRDDDISAYFLENENNNVEALQVNEKKLKHYIESVNFDLRGTNNG